MNVLILLLPQRKNVRDNLPDSAMSGTGARECVGRLAYRCG